MLATTLKKAVLILALSSVVPLAACSDDPETPTSSTQPGPTVTEPPTTTTPPPDPTPPTPTPPTDDRPVVSITGVVVNLTRGGEGSLDITFRIDDFTIVRAPGGTAVTSGSQTFNTDAVRTGQTVTAQGKRDNGFLDATRIDIITQAPE